MDIENPYWSDLLRLIHEGDVSFSRVARTIEPIPGKVVDFNTIQARYSRTIADPDTVEWVAEIAENKIVIPDAGLGYWPYLLDQYPERQVEAFDARTHGWSPWFRKRIKRINHNYHPLSGYTAYTLLMVGSQFPYTNVVAALRQYKGRQIIMICDRPWIALRLSDVLDREWRLARKLDTNITRLDEPKQVYEYERVASWNLDTRPYPHVEGRRPA